MNCSESPTLKTSSTASRCFRRPSPELAHTRSQNILYRRSRDRIAREMSILKSAESAGTPSCRRALISMWINHDSISSSMRSTIATASCRKYFHPCASELLYNVSIRPPDRPPSPCTQDLAVAGTRTRRHPPGKRQSALIRCERLDRTPVSRKISIHKKSASRHY